MKSIFLIITLLVVSLSSFTTYKSFVASISLIQTTDSIPAMNKQIIEFVKTKIKKKFQINTKNQVGTLIKTKLDI